jgi:O-antigen/teichoic acid export membrane protein
MTSGLGAGQVFSYLQKNVDYWSVSLYVGGPALGMYYMAYVLPNIVRTRISQVTRQVMLPAFVAAGSSADQARLWQRSFIAQFGVGLPLLVGIAVAAEPLVKILLGSQWTPAIVPMRVLTLVTIADLILTSVGTVAVAQNKVRAYLLVLGSRAASTAVFALCAALIFGSVTAVAYGVAISATLTLAIQEIFLGREMGVGVLAAIKPICVLLCLTLWMVVAVLCVAPAVSRTPEIVQLLTYTTTGVLAYIGGGYLVARSLLRVIVIDARQVLLGR